MFGLQGETIFTSGGYASGDVSKSPLYEYSIILFLAVFLLLNPKSKLQVFLVSSFVFYYTVKSLMYGGRIELMQLWLIVLYLKFGFFIKHRFKLFLIAMMSFFFMEIFSQIRANPLLLDSLNEIVFFNKDLEGDYISNQFGDVYQSSLRVIGLLNDGYISSIDAIASFFLVIFSIVFPSSVMPDLYNLASYLQTVERSGGGGFISAFSFIWLSYLGPVIFGFFIGYIIRRAYLSENLSVNVYGVLVLVSFPRWFAYYPVVLFKFALLGGLMIAMLLMLRRYIGIKR